MSDVPLDGMRGLGASRTDCHLLAATRLGRNRASSKCACAHRGAVGVRYAVAARATGSAMPAMRCLSAESTPMDSRLRGAGTQTDAAGQRTYALFPDGTYSRCTHTRRTAVPRESRRSPSATTHRTRRVQMPNSKIDQGADAPWTPQETRMQGTKTQSNVLATRKPAMKYRKPSEYPKRYAERRCSGALYHEPPRNTRRSQSPPTVQAPPSAGAPA